MSLIARVRAGQTLIRVFNTTASQDLAVNSSTFRSTIEKNMGLATPLLDVDSSIGVSLTELQHTSKIGKHVMLTVENDFLIAYMLDTEVEGVGGDDTVKKFSGGEIADTDSGVSWDLLATGTATPNKTTDPSGPRTWPFLLFRRRDIS